MLRRLLLRHPHWTALLIGLASATGFAPLDLWPLTLACLALWMWLIFDAPSLKGALWRGWLFGLGHFTVGNNWIQHAFDFQDRMPPALGYVAVVALALYLAVYPAMAAGLAWRYGRGSRPDAGYAFAFAAAWIATEYLRATMFTGYAWNPLAVMWLPAGGVAQATRWIGTYALSGVTIVIAGAIVAAFHRRWAFAGATAIIVVAFGVAAVPGAMPPDAPGAPHVRVVQPNVGQEVTPTPNHGEYVFSRLLRLSGPPQGHPRLLLWPEGEVTYFLEDGYPPQWYWQSSPELARDRIAALLGPKDIALVGSTALEFDKQGDLKGAGNSIFAIRPDGSLTGRYDKAHLVPYGEYLPMRWLLEPLGLSRLVAGDYDFLPGPGPQTLTMPGYGKVGMQICYEIIFSGQVVDEANRPDILFNPSNDAWFGNWGPPEHLAQARMRAIEEGLPILRSTPNGISAVIDAHGRLVGTVPRYTAGVVDVPMPKPLPPTLFSRIGNWMAAIVGLLFIAAAVALRRRNR
ncbi:apolipoprotein N-acyltransferase [Stakelama marina]|uniref:Apolipoprotein N-acyltransferase n=1 Tax=Stakelama marina TaxID=2826939 RepID=A0A8T4IG73_9SPHN|nr:apolipoprotein N-acyltransferase [Stakelama marina]MBR0553560.1 apolipoprotein N-acyltransferase [Stakelama marina]